MTNLFVSWKDENRTNPRVALLRTLRVRDLFDGHDGAEVICAVTGHVVRQLALIGDTLELKAGADQCAIAADTQLHYEPWLMDRGSVLVASLEYGTIKLCTEFDIIRFEDGTEVSLCAEMHAVTW
jgi:hypothetical protein